MNTLKFKTNINCGGCLASVSPALDTQEGIHSWQVDLAHPDRILTVETESLNAAVIQETVASMGFKAEPVSGGIFSKLFGK